LAALSAVALDAAGPREDWRGAVAGVVQDDEAGATSMASRRLIVFDADDGQLPFDYYYDRMVANPADRARQTGVPVGFFENDPPRAMLRVEGLDGVSRLRELAASEAFDEVTLVLSHTAWADPRDEARAAIQAQGWVVAGDGKYAWVEVLRYRRSPAPRTGDPAVK
jgi:hypothetical protein